MEGMKAYDSSYDMASRVVVGYMLEHASKSLLEIDRETNGRVKYSRMRDIVNAERGAVRISELIILSKACGTDPVIALREIEALSQYVEQNPGMDINAIRDEYKSQAHNDFGYANVELTTPEYTKAQSELRLRMLDALRTEDMPAEYESVLEKVSKDLMAHGPQGPKGEVTHGTFQRDGKTYDFTLYATERKPETAAPATAPTAAPASNPFLSAATQLSKVTGHTMQDNYDTAAYTDHTKQQEMNTPID